MFNYVVKYAPISNPLRFEDGLRESGFVKRYLNFDIRTIYTNVLETRMVSSTWTNISFRSMPIGGGIVVLLWSLMRSCTAAAAADCMVSCMELPHQSTLCILMLTNQHHANIWILRDVMNFMYKTAWEQLFLQNPALQRQLFRFFLLNFLKKLSVSIFLKTLIYPSAKTPEFEWNRSANFEEHMTWIVQKMFCMCSIGAQFTGLQ